MAFEDAYRMFLVGIIIERYANLAHYGITSSVISTSRRNDVMVLCRVRSGYTHALPINSCSQNNNKKRPTCSTCNTPLTIVHILTFCSTYTFHRQLPRIISLTYCNALPSQKLNFSSSLIMQISYL